jgi:thiol-disulfide isomerase/thioredoxin
MGSATHISRRQGLWAVAALALLMVGLLLGWPMVARPLFGSSSNDQGAYFKKLGINRMARITPPVDFILADPAGRSVRLSDLKGKVVFINFWTTWCGACRIEMPAMQGLHEHLKDRDFVMLAVDLQEPPEQVKRYLDIYKLTFTALLDKDGEVSRSFGIRSIPTTFIIDKQGALIGMALGPRDWNHSDSRALFEYLITAAPPGAGKARQAEKDR